MVSNSLHGKLVGSAVREQLPGGSTHLTSVTIYATIYLLIELTNNMRRCKGDHTFIIIHIGHNKTSVGLSLFVVY